MLYMYLSIGGVSWKASESFRCHKSASYETILARCHLSLVRGAPQPQKGKEKEKEKGRERRSRGEEEEMNKVEFNFISNEDFNFTKLFFSAGRGRRRGRRRREGLISTPYLSQEEKQNNKD